MGVDFLADILNVNFLPGQNVSFDHFANTSENFAQSQQHFVRFVCPCHLETLFLRDNTAAVQGTISSLVLLSEGSRFTSQVPTFTGVALHRLQAGQDGAAGGTILGIVEPRLTGDLLTFKLP